MNGWMDGWIDGWMDVWMDGWIDGCMDGWMDKCMEIYGWMEMDEWMNCKWRLIVLISYLTVFHWGEPDNKQPLNVYI
jgi:hypothetical protein